MTAPMSWPGLSYGAVERLLASLEGTSAEAVRTRFRKLRQRPFPDEIRAGTGVRVTYDLPRILALAAVFDLNRLYIPQGHAVAMVEAGWPEWCKAAIAAASGLGLCPAPAGMPCTASPLLRIAADAFRGEDGGPEVTLGWHGATVPLFDGTAAPSILVDLSRIVEAIASAAGKGSRTELGAAFTSLERAFGWTDPPTPHRASVAEMSRGRGFLDDGPFFSRARTLLAAPAEDFDPALNQVARIRLQWLLAYLERPAPIDRWKAEIGDDEERPRLKHLLNAWARERGLDVAVEYPEVLRSSGGHDLRSVALRYIAEAEGVAADTATDSC